MTNRESTAPTVVTSLTLAVSEKMGVLEVTLYGSAVGSGGPGLPVSTVGAHPMVLSSITPTSNMVMVASSVFTVS